LTLAGRRTEKREDADARQGESGMIRYGIGVLAACLVAGVAQAAAVSPAEIVKAHVAAGGDLDKLMADYADDAVVLQAGRVLQGKAAIRAFSAGMFAKRPASGSPARSAPAMKVTRVWQEGDIGFVTWEMGPVKATEDFVVRDGKIAMQAVFMNGAPRP
jgi:ketosteroid isomerase-like protein